MTIRGSHYAEIVDLRDGLITRFLTIQDLSAFVEAYQTLTRHDRLDPNR